MYWALRDDLEMLVMDADVLAEILELQEAGKSKEMEVKIIARLRKHQDLFDRAYAYIRQYY